MNGELLLWGRMERIFIYTKWVIDRIEEDLAVIENISTLESVVWAVADLPEGAREGSALVREEAGATGFLLDTSDEAKERSRRIREKFERLKKARD